MILKRLLTLIIFYYHIPMENYARNERAGPWSKGLIMIHACQSALKTIVDKDLPSFVPFCAHLAQFLSQLHKQDF